VIVRIATEDQFEVSQEDYERVNDLDNAVVAAVEAGDEERYAKTFAELIDFVHTHGRKLADDELAESDVIIPPSDTSLEQAAADFTGEGVIPESVLPGSGG
jgi:predicted transcriptional regulator